MSTPGPAIAAQELGRSFGNTNAISAVNLSIGDGEIVGLLGPDGAGKTTLLQLFASILDPTEGRCTVLGFDTVRQADAITAQIGYMPQGFTLYGRLTVEENLSFAARVRNVSTADFASRRDRLLNMAGLAPFLHRREEHLSGGMRKKLALCTNLIHEPPLLLLDEPGLGVDPLSRRELWRMLEQFRELGRTIVFSTSYTDEAERCDRVAFLDRGRIIALGTPDELRARSKDTVYRVVTSDLVKADALLHRRKDVRGIQWQAGNVRFMIDRPGTLPPALQTSLEQLGHVEPVAPTIEDAYVALRGADVARDVEPAPTIRLGVGTPDRPASEYAIETRALTRRFGTFVAVDAVTLTVSPGEIFGLLGANGAGKTTLIRMLCGLLAPSAGSARVAGFDASATPRLLRQHIGYMSQRFSLYPDLTVDENLAFFASSYGTTKRLAEEVIRSARETVGLDHIRSELVSRLSGALRQRLALACSILHQPAVLFLDEPTSGVDPLSRFRFWRLVNALAASGSAVLITTHYLEEAVYCQRLGLMNQGRLIAVGDLASLRSGIAFAPNATVEDVFIAYIERDRKLAAAGGRG
jgi:ABC-2 type transport system ATP-binding protein